MRLFSNCYLPVLLFSGIATVAGAQDAGPMTAPTPKPASGPHDYATMPEGKTLPENVARARVVYAVQTGTGHGFDKDGNKTDIPFDVKAAGGAVVLEYGVNDRISVLLRQDYRTAYEVKTNKSSSFYKDAKAGIIAQSAAGIADVAQLRAAFCGNASKEACYASILDGTAKNAAGAAIDVKGISVPKDARILDVLSAVAEQGLDAALGPKNSEGGKGIGDTTIGLLYALIDDGATQVSVGGGIRYPLGNRDRGVGETKVGRGLTEVGLRLNVDLLPLEATRVSWQNDTEGMLAAGKYKMVGEEVTVKRNGLHNVGFLVVKQSLSGISSNLSFIAPKLGLAYDYDSEEILKVGSAEEASSGPRSSSAKWLAGLGFNFFEFHVPAQLEFEYYKSYKGKNLSAATDSFNTQLKAYYKF